MHILNELCVIIALLVLFVCFVPGSLLFGVLLRVGALPGKILSVILVLASVGLLSLLYGDTQTLDTRLLMQSLVAGLYFIGFAVASFAERRQ